MQRVPERALREFPSETHGSMTVGGLGRLTLPPSGLVLCVLADAAVSIIAFGFFVASDGCRWGDRNLVPSSSQVTS